MTERELDSEDFTGYQFEPETMPCGHNMTYRCSDCKKCYQCRHRAIERGDGSRWWKCPTGKQKRALPDSGVKI